MNLEALSRRRGRLLAPQLVDQLVRRDRLVGTSQQDRQQRTLQAADDGDCPPVLVDFERAEDPELHDSVPPKSNVHPGGGRLQHRDTGV